MGGRGEREEKARETPQPKMAHLQADSFLGTGERGPVDNWADCPKDQRTMSKGGTTLGETLSVRNGGGRRRSAPNLRPWRERGRSQRGMVPQPSCQLDLTPRHKAP